MQLDLQRCAQFRRQEVGRILGENRLDSGAAGRTRAQQPVQVFTLAVGDVIEGEDVGTVADFLHRRTAHRQRMAQVNHGIEMAAGKNRRCSSA
ncbi:hypothetical protein [Paraburkholderia phenazinium]|uniref:hypothetical protein n=1 Tax=Paraburkholderia phenazinium TaxID=60549 RepID=UPI00158A1720|nr:hypothetical protein [Paraburkholderia phenazinium]